MAFWTEGLRFTEEAFFIEKRNKRYGLLNTNVFSKLSETSVQSHGISHTIESRLKVGLNIADVQSSEYFSEAEKHLAKDLPNYFTEIEKLKTSVIQYNEQVDRFLNETIRTRIETLLNQQTPELDIFRERDAIAPMNAISFPNLEYFLKEFWLLERDFSIAYRGTSGENDFRFNTINVATIPPYLENKLRNVIQQLKEHWEIKADISGLDIEKRNLINRAAELSNQVKAHIIVPIEKETYIRTCEDCKDITNLPKL